MINQYKRLDVFRCVHESHQGFGNVVSVYHVLKEKGCYPGGCVYFKWKCLRLDHKLPCPKSYKHIGRKCVSCTEYYDEKLIKRPRLLLSESGYKAFCGDLKDFEKWLNGQKNKEVNCLGTISGIKPRFVLNHSYGHSALFFKGFMLTFQEGFIGLTHFNDTFYALLGSSQQGRLRLCDGDRLEFRATLRLDRGRIILDRLRGIEIEEKNKAGVWTVERAKKALTIGKIHHTQYEKCIRCPYGALVDVEGDPYPKKENKKRRLFCMEGVSRPEYCIVQASKELVSVDCCEGD